MLYEAIACLEIKYDIAHTLGNPYIIKTIVYWKMYWCTVSNILKWYVNGVNH